MCLQVSILHTSQSGIIVGLKLSQYRSRDGNKNNSRYKYRYKFKHTQGIGVGRSLGTVMEEEQVRVTVPSGF